MHIREKEEHSFQLFAHIMLIGLTLLCLIPFMLLISASFTDELALSRFGYRLLPSEYSMAAYNYIFQNSESILRAVGISFLITITGTVCCVLFTAMLAYPLSIPQMPLRRFFTAYVILTILFNGGLVPTYLIYTQVLHIKNTLLGLLLPNLLMNGFNIMLAKTYLKNNIPQEIIEAGRIDGAGEAGIFFKLVFPISKPILVTIALMASMNYWNDWFNGTVYLSQDKLFSLQNLLNRILTNTQYLSQHMSNDLGMAAEHLPVDTAKMAIAIIAMLPIVIVYLFLQKYFVKGMAIGAVKG